MAQRFYAGQESNDFSEWTTEDTTDVKRFRLTAGSALGGSSFGVAANDGSETHKTVKHNVSITSVGGTHRLACRVNKNTLVMTTSGEHSILLLTTDAGTETSVAGLNFYESGGVIKARASVFDDAATRRDVDDSGTLPSGDVTLELRMKFATTASSNDGELELYVNGASVGSRADIDIFNNSFDTFGTRVHLIADGGLSSGNYYIDEFYYRDDDTQIYPASSASEFRFLGFDADTGTLMVSGLKDGGTLQLFDYDLAALGENGTASFGSATDTELDNRERGIFPVSRPSADDVWYLYGRDGNNVQVQYNDRNGTLGWTDIGAGTATWGSTKYAVALMPEHTLAVDVIVAFADADVYRTRYGTATWAVAGTTNTGLRTAARQVAARRNELLLAGTAAGTLEFSNNFGVSYGDVSGTALGVINALEVSL